MNVLNFLIILENAVKNSFYTFVLLLIIPAHLSAENSFFDSLFRPITTITAFFTAALKSERNNPERKLLDIIEGDATPQTEETKQIKELLKKVLENKKVQQLTTAPSPVSVSRELVVISESDTQTNQLLNQMRTSRSRRNHEAYVTISTLHNELLKKHEEHSKDHIRNPLVHKNKLLSGIPLTAIGLFGLYGTYRLIRRTIHDGKLTGNRFKNFLTLSASGSGSFFTGYHLIKTGLLYGKNLDKILERDRTIYAEIKSTLETLSSTDAILKPTVTTLMQNTEALHPTLCIQHSAG